MSIAATVLGGRLGVTFGPSALPNAFNITAFGLNVIASALSSDRVRRRRVRQPAARSIAETVVLRESREFLERRFAQGISITLVLEHRSSRHATMATDFWQLRNLPCLEQLDQMRTRDIEEVRRRLCSHGVVVLDHTDVFAGEE